jgi:NitT/TauT family transport system ATP-binding protein
VRGRDMTGPSRDIGMMFQSPVLLPWRTNLDNVLLPIEVFRFERNDYLAKARSLLKLVGLDAFADRYPLELSGGMQQRVAICRMLLYDPAVLLMDEPFSALDEMSREFMNLELLRIWEELRKTVLFVTHNIGEAVFLSDRVVVMSPRPGRISRIVPIDLPRPRSKATLASDAFFHLVTAVRKILDEPERRTDS